MMVLLRQSFSGIAALGLFVVSVELRYALGLQPALGHAPLDLGSHPPFHLSHSSMLHLDAVFLARFSRTPLHLDAVCCLAAHRKSR